jgi:fatty acid desaturase
MAVQERAGFHEAKSYSVCAPAKQAGLSGRLHFATWGLDKNMKSIAVREARPWDRPFWKPVRRKEGVLAYLVLIHVLAAVGLILFPLPSWKVVGLALLSIGFGGLGTTVCYHRMLAHRTLKTNKFLEHLLISWAVFNGSGHPASWVAYHRLHHSTTDTPDDISSPKQGGFWCRCWRFRCAAAWCSGSDRWASFGSVPSAWFTRCTCNAW